MQQNFHTGQLNKREYCTTGYLWVNKKGVTKVYGLTKNQTTEPTNPGHITCNKSSYESAHDCAQLRVQVQFLLPDTYLDMEQSTGW